MHLKDFKESGKFIVAYGDSYSQGLYYLSSVADKVLLNPQGMVEWRAWPLPPCSSKGFAGQNRSRNADIQSRYLQIGCRAFHLYRNEPQPWTNRRLPDLHLGTSDQWCCRITQNICRLTERHWTACWCSIPQKKVCKCGLVDTLIYKNDVRNYLKDDGRHRQRRPHARTWFCRTWLT